MTAIVCVTESRFDAASIRILVRRVWEGEGAQGAAFPQIVLFSVRRGKVVKEAEFKGYIEQAARRAGPDGAVLVIFDADDECPAELAPRLLEWAAQARGDFPVRVALAKFEIECWLIAGAESLRGVRGLPDDLEAPAEPERIRDAKGWLTKARRDGVPYSPPVDQAGLMERLDLDRARTRSGSLDRCLREIERLLAHPEP